MNSVELYNKLKGFWAKKESGANLSPPPSIKFPGKRWLFKIFPNGYRAWVPVKWMPVISDEKKWARLTYEEFCYALGLEMVP
jgi:hypothetical protein